jgi:hypothetical protein
MSYNNLNSVTSTIVSYIWENIKNDADLTKIISSSSQISLQSPKELQVKTSKAQLSIYLYSITELSSMRKQPQPAQGPATLLYLNLRYLITPITSKEQESQILLGKNHATIRPDTLVAGSFLKTA